MKIPELEAAASGNPALRRVLTKIQSWTEEVEKGIGFAPFGTGKAGRKRVIPPPLAGMIVEGLDGHFQVQITPPESATGTMFHEVKSSTTIPFVASQDVISHGVSPEGHLDIILPNSTRYFQLRSRYSTSDFNQPQPTTDAIFSGVLSSRSIPPGFTKYETSNVGPILTQQDTSAVILVAPNVMQMGDETVSYDGGTITVDSAGNPLTYTTYYVYADDLGKDGGAVIYQATTDIGEATGSDARVRFGTITLLASGGGIGYGFGYARGSLVGTLVTMFNGSAKLIQDVVIGDTLKGADAAVAEVVTETPVALDAVPCFAFGTQNSKSMTASADQNLQSGPGVMTRADQAVLQDSINTADGQEYITSKTYAGSLTVYRLRLSGSKFYLANGVWVHDGS